MKIYNEVVYNVVDDNLVKVSEDFFEYKGEVLKCGGGGSAGEARGIFDNAMYQVMAGESGKGTIGQIGSKIYGGTVKKTVDQAQGRTGGDGEDEEALTYTAGEDESEADLNIETPEEELLRGRQYANLTQGQTARSLLTENIS